MIYDKDVIQAMEIGGSLRREGKPAGPDANAKAKTPPYDDNNDNDNDNNIAPMGDLVSPGFDLSDAYEKPRVGDRQPSRSVGSPIPSPHPSNRPSSPRSPVPSTGARTTSTRNRADDITTSSPKTGTTTHHEKPNTRRASKRSKRR
jgi:hypothetical protein